MSVQTPRYFWLPRWPGRGQAIVGLAAAAPLMASMTLSSGARYAARVERPVAAEAAPSPAEMRERDLELRELVVGRWRGTFHGERVVDNRPDGTATMHIDFDFVAGFFYGPQMTLELSWDVQEGVLTYGMTSGTPVDKYNKLISDYGDAASYSFEEVSDRIMRLVRTTDPSEKYTWFRVD